VGKGYGYGICFRLPFRLSHTCKALLFTLGHGFFVTIIPQICCNAYKVLPIRTLLLKKLWVLLVLCKCLRDYFNFIFKATNIFFITISKYEILKHNKLETSTQEHVQNKHINVSWSWYILIQKSSILSNH
jgi:hypothetical protein